MEKPKPPDTWRNATPLSGPQPAAAEQPEELAPAEIRARVVHLYQKHRPAQARNVDKLLERFRGREIEVLRKAEALFKDQAPPSMTVVGISDSEQRAAKRPRVAAPAAQRWSGVGMQPVPGLAGSRFEVVRAAEGAGARAAGRGDKVSVQVTGRQVHTGRQFWSTRDSGPHTFRVGAGDVVQGLDLGVVGMREGEERRIIVAASEGYGQEGFAPLGIDPGATLDYVVELVRVL
eukprot:TRINITY_DN15272_c0_g1_i1.p3 TRINITY_DN15272_c0_g1~~TRINITY_DN15272_c0_g1_i1.p3  ORF type:complete len:270 (+),score=96.86 TRINITY_DN15272_c0_g1_i1:114-812(+)